MLGQPDAMVLDLRGNTGCRVGVVVVYASDAGWKADPQQPLPWLWQRTCDDFVSSGVTCSPLGRSPYVPAIFVRIRATLGAIKLDVQLNHTVTGTMVLDGALGDPNHDLAMSCLCFRSPTWMAPDRIALNWATRHWVVGW